MKLKHFKLIFLCLLVAFTASNSLATENNLATENLANVKLFPPGCRPIGYSFKYNVLMLSPESAGQSQSLYFIHNKASSPVKLYQMRTGEEIFAMYLNNEIKSNQWGAFATDEKQVKFICTVPDKKSKYGEIVDCKNVLELCEYPNVEFAPNNHGNYWSVESNPSWLGTRREVIWQGILLRW